MPKRIITLICSLLLVVAQCPQVAFADVRKADLVSGVSVEQRDLSIADCPSIEAQYAALASADGTVYFERNASEQHQIASITKVMTAIVTLDNAPSDLPIIVTEEAAQIGESSANLQEGDEMDLTAALKALLVPSGNDAAVALATAVGNAMIDRNPALGDDPVSVFVDAMNEKASSLGCQDTLYENPHGLDDDEYEGQLHSTALDQLNVARCAMTYPLIREIVAGGSTSISVKRGGAEEQVELETTDLLLDSYERAIGIKTGMTNLAGYSFMGASVKDGLELYAVVLDSADEYTRFEDAEALFEWAYDHIKSLPLANSQEYTTMRYEGASSDVPVIAEVAHKDWMDRTVKATLDDPGKSLTVFDLEGNVSQSVELDELHGTVRTGDKVGSISFKQRNRVVATCDLVACESVEAPNPIDTIAIWWQRSVLGFGEGQDEAQSQVYNVMPILDNNTSNAA